MFVIRFQEPKGLASIERRKTNRSSRGEGRDLRNTKKRREIERGEQVEMIESYQMIKDYFIFFN